MFYVTACCTALSSGLLVGQKKNKKKLFEVVTSLWKLWSINFCHIFDIGCSPKPDQSTTFQKKIRVFILEHVSVWQTLTAHTRCYVLVESLRKGHKSQTLVKVMWSLSFRERERKKKTTLRSQWLWRLHWTEWNHLNQQNDSPDECFLFRLQMVSHPISCLYWFSPSLACFTRKNKFYICFSQPHSMIRLTITCFYMKWMWDVVDAVRLFAQRAA